MAVAEKTTVERVVEVGFTLTLTVEEAETLVAVLARVGGDPDDSPRARTQSVLDALLAAGSRDWWDPGHPGELLNGVLSFDHYPAEEN